MNDNEKQEAIDHYLLNMQECYQEMVNMAKTAPKRSPANGRLSISVVRELAANMAEYARAAIEIRHPRERD